MTPLAAWVLSFMIASSPPASAVKHRHEVDLAHVGTRYAQIAEDITSVALDPVESLKDRPGAALWLAAQALCESAFDWRVDAGKCTPGTCDNGKAWSMWQIHDEGGLVFLGAKYTYARVMSAAWREEHFREIYDGPALVRDRRLAARMALHMRRVSPQQWSTWKCAASSAATWTSANPFPKEAP